MNKLPPGKRIVIIEGIAGSGKNRLQQEFSAKLSRKNLHSFSEEELLFSWKHFWIEGIDEIRLRFMKRLTDHISHIIHEDPDSFFILNRFHLSWRVFCRARSGGLLTEYRALVDKLRALPIHLVVLQLEEEEIMGRALHNERADPMWQKHLQRRLHVGRYTTLEDMYQAEQNAILRFANEQKVAFVTSRVSAA